MFTLPLRDYPFNEGKSQFHWEAYIQMVTMRWHQPHVSTPGWPTCSWQFFVSKLLEMERAYPLKAAVSTTKVPNISNILRPTSIFVVTLNRISIRFWNSKAWKRVKIERTSEQFRSGMKYRLSGSIHLVYPKSREVQLLDVYMWEMTTTTPLMFFSCSSISFPPPCLIPEYHRDPLGMSSFWVEERDARSNLGISTWF